MLRIGTNSLREALLTWYISAMIKRPAAQRSQVNDRPAADHYAALHGGFGWQVPEHFNMAEACCQRWSRLRDAGRRIAVLEDGTDAVPRSYSYAQLQDQANRLSNALLGLGVQRGDRVAIVMPQRFETAVAYMAVLQMGAVAMPLSMLFGPEALEFLQHVTSNDVSRLAPGRIQYSALTTPEGTFVDDLLVYKRGDDDYLLVINAGNTPKDVAWLHDHAKGYNLRLEDVSPQWCQIAVQGPRAREVSSMASVVISLKSATDLARPQWTRC